MYAEDPARQNAPSPGLVTRAEFPDRPGVRVDGWIETGLEVTPFYDPMLAKVIATAPGRDGALDLLGQALGESRVDGVVTNLGLLRSLVDDLALRCATHSTSTLDVTADPDPRIDVLVPGAMTTVQDLPGRLGHWQVGVPPSGPMDPLSLREANLAVGNPVGAPGLEITATGPTLRFSVDSVVCVTGAPAVVTVDDAEVAMWEPVEVPAGSVLGIGTATGPGLRLALAVRGGLDVPHYLGSASTFTLGGFGGHGGRALRAGDVLRPGPATGEGFSPVTGPVPPARRPEYARDWTIGVTEGPHAAPEFFTRADLDEFYATGYEVHLNSARTGVRLIGPRPRWARSDGGEAGLHPSNIHDTPYAVGAIDFTGDTPIVLGPDGPSLGGFVCPAVVASAELWKVGQLRPGDRVRFAPVREAEAATPRLRRDDLLGPRGDGDDGILARTPAAPGRPAVTYRRDGDDNVLVEYGEQVLDLGLRMRVHALMRAFEENRPDGHPRRDPRHPVPAGPHRPRPAAGVLAGGSAARARRRPARHPRPRRALAPGPAAALLGRPRHPAGHRALRRRGPLRRSLDPLEPGVHPPHERPGLRRRRVPHRVRRPVPRPGPR